MEISKRDVSLGCCAAFARDGIDDSSMGHCKEPVHTSEGAEEYTILDNAKSEAPYDLCKRCRKIDFHHVFDLQRVAQLDQDRREMRTTRSPFVSTLEPPRDLLSLGRPVDWPQAGCRSCDFWRACIMLGNGNGDGGGEFKNSCRWYLKAFITDSRSTQGQDWDVINSLFAEEEDFNYLVPCFIIKSVPPQCSQSLKLREIAPRMGWLG